MPSVMGLDVNEVSLLAALRRGDPEASGTLVRRYREALIVHAQHVLRDRGAAEDVTQEVLMKATGEALPTETRSLSGWLHAVTWRAAVDRLRQRDAERRAIEGRAATRTVEPVPLPPALASGREEKERVIAALHALDEPYRSAVVLRYLAGLDFPEIALRLDTIERTARTWVGRGLTALRAELGRPGGGP